MELTTVTDCSGIAPKQEADEVAADKVAAAKH